MSGKPVIAFDVDGVLVYGEENEPRWEVLQLLRTLAASCEIWVWSGGGREYAEHMGRILFLPQGVRYLAKPVRMIQKGIRYPGVSGDPSGAWTGADICFDDEDVKLAKVNVKI